MASLLDSHLSHLKRIVQTWAQADEIAIREEWVRENAGTGYVRLRVKLKNGDLFEAAEFFVRQGNRVATRKYRHHWQDASGNLIKRWDNAAHHPELANYPHHVHNGHEDNVIPSQTDITLDIVLQQITAHLQEESV